MLLSSQAYFFFKNKKKIKVVTTTNQKLVTAFNRHCPTAPIYFIKAETSNDQFFFQIPAT